MWLNYEEFIMSNQKLNYEEAIAWVNNLRIVAIDDKGLKEEFPLNVGLPLKASNEAHKMIVDHSRGQELTLYIKGELRAAQPKKEMRLVFEGDDPEPAHTSTKSVDDDIPF